MILFDNVVQVGTASNLDGIIPTIIEFVIRTHATQSGMGGLKAIQANYSRLAVALESFTEEGLGGGDVTRSTEVGFDGFCLFYINSARLRTQRTKGCGSRMTTASASGPLPALEADRTLAPINHRAGQRGAVIRRGDIDRNDGLVIAVAEYPRPARMPGGRVATPLVFNNVVAPSGRPAAETDRAFALIGYRAVQRGAIIRRSDVDRNDGLTVALTDHPGATGPRAVTRLILDDVRESCHLGRRCQCAMTWLVHGCGWRRLRWWRLGCSGSEVNESSDH